jgi:hypothetical protein
MVLADNDDARAELQFALLPPALREILQLLAAIFASHPVFRKDHKQECGRLNCACDQVIEWITPFNAPGIAPENGGTAGPLELEAQVIEQAGDKSLGVGRRILRQLVIGPCVGHEYLYWLVLVLRHASLSRRRDGRTLTYLLALS